ERRGACLCFVISLFFETESSPFSLSRNRSSEKAILLLSLWIVDIPAILPVSTPPNGILCLCGSCDYAILPLSPWINWNWKIRLLLGLISSSILSCGGSPRRLTELSVSRWLSSMADGAICLAMAGSNVLKHGSFDRGIRSIK
ncbi:hypothetical protein HID58_052236, partial [Brassica napus]